jgi:hypothetical protein
VEKQADPSGHGHRGQPVTPPHLHPAADGHVGEDEEKLEHQDGLDQGERPEAEGTDVKARDLVI